MATKLSISDLADVVAELKEVTKPYQLGIQLKIDSSKLKVIEKDYPRDIDRQKTEVIEYWLRNSPDPSWTTLASAVERMGGYTKLVEALREKEQGRKTFDQETIYKKGWKQSSTSLIPSNTCVPRNILLLGKMGHGKSTLGNRMLNDDGCFRINDQQCPQTTHGSAVLSSASQRKNFKFDVYDHSGLFEVTSIDTFSSAVSSSVCLHVVIFVLNCGCSFDVSEIELIRSIISKWKIGEISTLVLTHCERLSEEERERVIEQFKKDHPSVAALMGKGIIAVGFPDKSHIKPGSELSQQVEKDKARLRKLIYVCSKSVFIPEAQPSESESKQLLSNKREQPPQVGTESRQPPQNVGRQYFCCLIL